MLQRVFWSVLFIVSFNTIGLALLLLTTPVLGLLGSGLLGSGVLWWHFRRGDQGQGRRAVVRIQGPRTSFGPVLCGCSSSLALLLGLVVVIEVFGPDSAFALSPLWDEFVDYRRTTAALLAAGVLTVLVIPIAEEFVFRGWIQRGFEERLPATISVFFSALLFSFLHLGGAHWWLAIVPFCLGVTAGAATVFYGFNLGGCCNPRPLELADVERKRSRT